MPPGAIKLYLAFSTLKRENKSNAIRRADFLGATTALGMLLFFLTKGEKQELTVVCTQDVILLLSSLKAESAQTLKIRVQVWILLIRDIAAVVMTDFGVLASPEHSPHPFQ